MMRASVVIAVITQAIVCFCQNQVPTELVPSLPNAEVDCYTRCESTPSCSGLDPRRNPSEANSNCALCIEALCALYRQDERNTLPNCIVEARTNCSECPDPTSLQLQTFQNCRDCVDVCYTGQGSQEVASDSCTGYCQSISFCPTDDEIIDSLERTTTQCRSCVTNECGDVFSQSNRAALASCLYRVRGECSACVLSSEVRLARRYCGNCVAQCNAAPTTSASTPTVTVTGRAISSVNQQNQVNSGNNVRPTGILNRVVQRTVRYTLLNALRPYRYHTYQPYTYQPYVYRPYYRASNYRRRRVNRRQRRPYRNYNYYQGYAYLG